jgi:hypothetical protein
MLLGDIVFSLITAMINTFFTTGLFSVINNFVSIPFRVAGV